MFVFCCILFNIIFQCVASTKSLNTTECGLNEYLVKCKTTCPPQSCDLAYTEYLCDPNPNPKCVPGCDCIENYLRDDTGMCIFNEDCPYPIPPPLCGEFEEPIIICDDSDIHCNSDDNCKCIDKYVRNSNGICVPIAQNNTILCGYNEVPSDCQQTCPPQDCDFSYDKYACKAGPCRPGCNCKGNYLRNSTGDCVPKEQCDTDEYEEPEDKNRSEASSASASASAYASSSAHSYASSSSDDMKTNTGGASCIYDRCTPTCSVPNPRNCPQTSNPCNCATGYILSEKGGQCVKLEECQKYKNCNGDRNATRRQCANSCKSTCKRPNAVCKYGKKKCESYGCQCDSRYLLSDEGKCILPDDCPGGNPCRQNEFFVSCNVGCPTNYCPTSDSRAVVACDPSYPCPSGCSCKVNHKRLSYDDDRCIVASDCPPVNCTRQNEEWNACPPPCFTETCRDLNQPPPLECYPSVPDCQPQCVCKDGYRRNDIDICIPIKEC